MTLIPIVGKHQPEGNIHYITKRYKNNKQNKTKLSATDQPNSNNISHIGYKDVQSFVGETNTPILDVNSYDDSRYD